jgi:ketosteroid isomerase-like protein
MPTEHDERVEAVLDHHLEAFGSQDLDAVLEDYDDDSVVVTHMGTFRGLDEIETLFADVFDEFSQAGSEIDLEQQVVEGDTAYIVWNGETPDNDYEFATDTFQIRDGVIEHQTFAAKVEPKP